MTRLGNVTAFSFDTLGDEISQSLPDPANGMQDGGSPTTTFTFDADHNTLSLTDPDGNTTFWTYNGEGQVTSQSEVVALGYYSDGTLDSTNANYYYRYDLDGNVTQSIDADGQVIQYQYNSANQETAETWYPTAADAEAGTGSDGGETFTYDTNQNMLTANNAAADYTYQQ